MAIRDEVGFKNEIMTDFVVDNMHLFDRFKRRCNAFSSFFIITHLNDSNISYKAYVIVYMAHIIWVDQSSENSSSALIYAIIRF